MSDVAPKTPTMASVGPMAFTAISSSAIGDQVGDALAKILAWTVAYKCQCAPPPEIINAFHTICVVSVMGIAFVIHYLVIKHMAKGDTA